MVEAFLNNETETSPDWDRGKGSRFAEKSSMLSTLFALWHDSSEKAPASTKSFEPDILADLSYLSSDHSQFERKVLLRAMSFLFFLIQGVGQAWTDRDGNAQEGKLYSLLPICNVREVRHVKISEFVMKRLLKEEQTENELRNTSLFEKFFEYPPPSRTIPVFSRRPNPAVSRRALSSP